MRIVYTVLAANYDYLSGVESVEINRKQQKVTVVGYVEASKVLKKAEL